MSSLRSSSSSRVRRFDCTNCSDEQVFSKMQHLHREVQVTQQRRGVAELRTVENYLSVFIRRRRSDKEGRSAVHTAALCFDNIMARTPNRGRRLRPQVRSEELPQNLTLTSAPKRLPDCYTVKSYESGVDLLERCVICLAYFKEQDEMALLSCKHNYHQACIQEHFERGHLWCPLDRQPAVCCYENSEDQIN